MPRRIRRNLTYANVASSLALFLAVAGGGAYAANEWTGANIQDETITGADVKGRAATDTTAAVPGSLSGADIKDTTLTYSDLAPGTIGTSRVANNSLTGDDIVESSLNVADTTARAFTNRFGDGGNANPGAGSAAQCTIGEIKLTAATWGLPGGALPAHGQLLPISEYESLFQLLGTTYGGDGEESFALPDMRAIEPDHMTYGICWTGTFPVQGN